ncbi:MAG: IPTL-CTERM sorting domain-containing protein [Phycisphaerales bacterium]|nr:IPTL-CTERM sorting domain-containing protein [Phycisphaerales bacterium]
MSVANTAMAVGNLLRVRVDPGTRVGIGYGVTGEGKDDVNNDGIVEFVIPKGITAVSVCKESDGKDLYYRVNINAGATTLASLAPFDLPPFTDPSGTTTLVAVITIDELINAGNPLGVNDSVTVTGGTIAETPWITFRDGSNLSNDPETGALQVNNNAILNALPNYSGTAEVEEFDLLLGAEPIPTVSEWGLIVMTLLLLTLGTVVLGQRRPAAA